LGEDPQATQDAATLTLTVEDWDDLTRGEQQSIISAALERADGARGRGAQRPALTAKR
jgi:hypothetical protein